MKDKKSRLPQEERREQIIRKTMEIINREGYSAFTTRRLAKEIGISEPALYRHFENKDEIIIGIISKMDTLWEELERELEKCSKLDEKICCFIMMHFKYISENPDLLAVLFADEYVRLNNNIRDAYYKTTEKRYSFLTQILRQGLENGEIKGNNTNAIAMIIVGAIRVTSLNWRNSGFSYSLQEFGEDVCINLTNMLICNKETERRRN